MQATVSHVSPFSGSWYPDRPAELDALLDRLIRDSERRCGPYMAPQPLAFVVPHAGLAYSGTVAASAYRHLAARRPERIILLGFAHRGSVPGLLLPAVDSIRTPLGEVVLDRETMERLASSGCFRVLPEAVLCDHSVEIQLPLLQKTCPGARLVPIYVSRLGPEQRAAAARELAALASAGTVFLASSDLTHYGPDFHYQPFPADDRVGDRLRVLDEGVIQAAASLQPGLFFDELSATASTVCGYEPIALLLQVLGLLDSTDEIFQETLDYQTSGEMTGDFRHSVSYAALGYFRYSSLLLGSEDQQLLLHSARATLDRLLATGQRTPVAPARRTEALERRAAAFVSLHQGCELRGCVGRRCPTESLADVVPSLALAAALDDCRFNPVTRGESGFSVEVSVLSPMKRIADRSRFHLNLHGALLEAGVHHALLLPQVASDRAWTAAQFFDALARKGGLPTSVYDDPGTRLYVFRGQVIQ